MLKSKLATAAAALALSFGAIGAAQASSLVMGDFRFIISGYDSGTTGYGVGAPTCNTVASCDAAATTLSPGSVGSINTSADTMGIFSIGAVERISDGVTVWSKGGANGYLTGVFGNLADHEVNSGCIGSSCSTTTNSTGGTWAIYKNAVDYNPTLGPLVGPGKDFNALQYPGISGGSVWLSGVFASGAILGDTTTTYTANYNTNTLAGGGQAYMDITGGTEQFTYDTNSLVDLNGTARDLFMDISFNNRNNVASNMGWTVIMAGQVQGNAVPEPGTMALAGLALLGAGLASRRRKS